MIDNGALARRAVACSAWRWMERMQVLQHYVPSTLCWLDKQGRWNASTGGVWMRFSDMSNLLPDLADPATLGCMLALVREAWGDPEACVIKGAFSGWRVHAGLGQPVHDWEPRDNYPTEAAALVAALEAAPAREVRP